MAHEARKSDQVRNYDIKSTSTVNFDMTLSSLDQREDFVVDHPEFHYSTL
jgi:hypothetical protein